MAVSDEQKIKEMNNLNEDQVNEQITRRPRSATLLNLKWLAEKLRLKNKLKEQIAQGSYQADSRKVAKAILNEN